MTTNQQTACKQLNLYTSEVVFKTNIKKIIKQIKNKKYYYYL